MILRALAVLVLLVAGTRAEAIPTGPVLSSRDVLSPADQPRELRVAVDRAQAELAERAQRIAALEARDARFRRELARERAKQHALDERLWSLGVQTRIVGAIGIVMIGLLLGWTQALARRLRRLEAESAGEVASLGPEKSIPSSRARRAVG